MVELPAWVPGTTLYQLHSLGASGAPTDNPDVDAREQSGRGLQVLERWLDHVAALGCGGVLLTPVFVSSTHGYDTVDPFRIDQRLGDDRDFDRFVGACHDRGLRLVLDGVLNHVGRQFGPFRDVLAHQQGAAHAGWFRLDFGRDDGDGFGYKTFEGHRELVALDHRSDAVLEWAISLANRWLDRGADGWRFDAAYAIPPAFLAQVASAVRSHHPEALLFGEVIHGDYRGFVESSGLHSVTQYELHKAIWSSLNDGNLFELAWALKRHRELLGLFAPITFVGNHDVTRIASQLTDARHVALAIAVLFAVPGVPCVYYGDELGWTGVKEHRAGGDAAIRTALPADPPAWSAIAELHQRLIQMRQGRPWLTTADVEIGELSNQAATCRVFDDDHELWLGLDTRLAPVEVPSGHVELAGGPGYALAERAAG